MKLLDANVLLYAVDAGAVQHGDARTALLRSFRSQETLLFPWVSLLAFVRLITHPSIYSKPLTTDAALDVVDGWLRQPGSVVPQPDERHGERLRALLADTGRGGNLVNDAHLAALAQQYRATVLTFDSDFGRFAGVAWERPKG